VRVGRHLVESRPMRDASRVLQQRQALWFSVGTQS
jgi:hypothetical protein